jgi:hypothetical protein
MIERKNLLFISISFPPKNDPECLQTARYFHYLQQTGLFSITVVTSKSPTLFMPIDDTLRKYLIGINQLIEIPLIENKIFNFLLRKLGLNALLFPDSKMTFHWQWRTALKKMKTKPDVIYSRSQPMSSAFMAARFAEYFNCPWIMHLSDPWAISPLHERSNSRQLKAEQKLVATATCVTLTTEATKSLYVSQYPGFSNKFRVLPNVFDPQDQASVNSAGSQKLRIVYTGGLAAKRSIFFLKNVLEEVKKAMPDFEQKVQFVFAGDMDRAHREFFKQKMPAVSHIGLLSYAKAKELCQSANLLLVIDNPTTHEGAVFFPSKLLDYFLTRRKIWAVTPIGSTTRFVLEGYNHEAFDHDDLKGMAEFLLKSIHQVEQGDQRSFTSDYLPAQYSADKNAKLLADLLLSVS